MKTTYHFLNLYFSIVIYSLKYKYTQRYNRLYICTGQLSLLKSQLLIVTTKVFFLVVSLVFLLIENFKCRFRRRCLDVSLQFSKHFVVLPQNASSL